MTETIIVEADLAPTIIEVITEGPKGDPGDAAGSSVTSVNGVTPVAGEVTLTKNNLGLGSAEDKSSATIRGEITSQNVTDALGFMPLSNSYAPTWASITGKPTFSSVALTGAYADLSGKPTFSAVATSGAYSDLTGTPTPYSLPTGSTTTLGGFKIDGTTIVAVDGVLSAVGGGGGGGSTAVKDEGTVLTAAATSIDFVGTGVTATVIGSAVTVTIPASTLATLGIPNVENKSSSTIRGELTSLNVTTALGFTPLANSYVPTWASITGKPTFATVATTGTYSDLSGLPTLLVLGSVAGTASAASGSAGSSVDAAKADHVHPHPTALQAGASIPGALMSSAAGLTAAGTTQTDALALTSDINYIGTAAANTGVRLPTVSAGKTVIVINRGANALKVYPATGHNIDTLAANASITVPVNGFLEFFGSSATQWNSTQNAITSASLIQGTVAGANGGTGVANSGKTLTLGGNHVNSGAFASTFTFTGTTTVTFPTSGTLSTLAGAETLTNKTLTAPVINNPTGITKANVGLGNVDDTSDLNKPISTATQTALNAKQDALVSGSNIKTVGGVSILGSGNIAAGGSDLVLIAGSTFSAASIVEFTSIFSATYDKYLIAIQDVTTSSASAAIYVRMITGTSTVVSTGYMHNRLNRDVSSVTFSAVNALSASEINLCGTIDGTASQWTTNIDLHLGKMNGAKSKAFYWLGNTAYGSTTTEAQGFGKQSTTSDVTGIRLFASTGTISGSIQIYGYKKAT